MKWVDETVPDSMRAWSWASRTFLVFGESAETRPFLRRRPTHPHTPSGNVECPVDWTHPVLYSTLVARVHRWIDLTRPRRRGEQLGEGPRLIDDSQNSQNPRIGESDAFSCYFSIPFYSILSPILLSDNLSTKA
jgi:hypothetical protein